MDCVLMKVSDIGIKKAFKRTEPREEKMKFCREFYKNNGYIDKPIIVDGRGVLIDGYIRYLVLRENNVNEVNVVVRGDISSRQPNTKIYVFGKHQMNGKEYCWVVNNNTSNMEFLKIGNKAIVKTSHGKEKITITRVEKSIFPPYTQKKVKGVIKCLNE